MKGSNTSLLAIIGCVLLVGLIAVWAGSTADRGDTALRTELAELRTEVNAELLARSSAAPQERVFQLPDDGGAWHVSLFVSRGWRLNPAERETVSWFYSHPTLNSLRTQAHWHLYTIDGSLFRERFRPVTGDATPTLLVSDQTGNVIYLGTRGQVPQTVARQGPWQYERMPDSPERLLDLLRQRFRDRCGPKPCPAPEPEPVPDENPDETNVVVPVNVQPDIGQEETADDTPWWLLAVAVVVAALLTIYISFRRDM